jgi:transcriptional regulator with XRE-family HTH domain
MKKANTHWTATPETFLGAIAADFVLQIKERANSQNELAEKLNRTKGRISQTLNDPGNFTLLTMVKYARALGMKVSVVLYDDIDDAENQFGPVHADIFRLCWEEKNRPRDFWGFQQVVTTRDAVDAASLERVVNVGAMTFADAVRDQSAEPTVRLIATKRI